MPAAVESRQPVSRTQRSAWSFASGVGALILSVLVGFVATPWILKWLGAERYGAWRVMIDCFAYLALFDLGLGGATMGLLAPAIGSGDSLLARRIVTSALAVYGKVTIAMLAAGAALVMALPWIVPLLRPSELRLAGSILLVSVFWTPVTVYKSLAEARQRAYQVNLALMAQHLLFTTGALLAASLQWGLPGQAAAQAAGLLFSTVILVWIGFRDYPLVHADVSSASLKAALWKLNWPTLVFNLTSRIGLLSDNIVVGWILGPALVAPFFLTQRLPSLAQQQLQGMGNATWAALVELHARGDGVGFRSRLLELSTLVSGIGLAVLAPIAAYNRQFIALWLGSKTYPGDSVTVLACINGWLWSIFSLWGWPVSGTGNIAAWAPYSVAFLAVNLAVSVVTTFAIGMTGPLWGTLAAFLSIQLWAMPRVIKKLFGIDPADLLMAAAKPLLFGAPYCAGVWMVARRAPWHGWLGLAIQMAGSAAAGVAIWWFTSLSGSQRVVWRARLAMMLGRRDASAV
jgi:O-antigen/teichoic acid export membrane protein